MPLAVQRDRHARACHVRQSAPKDAGAIANDAWIVPAVVQRQTLERRGVPRGICALLLPRNVTAGAVRVDYRQDCVADDEYVMTSGRAATRLRPVLKAAAPALVR